MNYSVLSRFQWICLDANILEKMLRKTEEKIVLVEGGELIRVVRNGKMSCEMACRMEGESGQGNHWCHGWTSLVYQHLQSEG